MNEGGESFPSETLSACRVADEKGRVLIVNGFDRVSAPLSERNDSLAGFRMEIDGGVPDRPASAIRRHPTAECRANRPAAGLPVGSGILWNGVWANFQINDYICPYDNATHAETLHHSGMQRRR